MTRLTYSTVVSAGTDGMWSSCRNMHLTLVLKHRHLAGHWASPCCTSEDTTHSTTHTTLLQDSTASVIPILAGTEKICTASQSLQQSSPPSLSISFFPSLPLPLSFTLYLSESFGVSFFSRRCCTLYTHQTERLLC